MLMSFDTTGDLVLEVVFWTFVVVACWTR